MATKFSGFIVKDTIANSDYVNVTGSGVNRRVVWPDFLDNIYDRIVTPFIYPTIALLQAAPLAADEDNPVYVRVEETDFTLYKITNTAPVAGDITLNNGNTATKKIEYQAAINVTTNSGATVQEELDNSEGALTKSIAGGVNVTLTAREALYRNIIFTGTITANISVIFPDATRRYRVSNYTTGLFTVNARTVSTGTGVIVARDETVTVRSDGSALIRDSHFREKRGRITGGALVTGGTNMIGGDPSNHIADDVHSSVIAGGGFSGSENVIGGLIASIDNSAISNVDPVGVTGTNARYSSIAAGYDNVNNAIASHITGAHCGIDIAADHGTICGGSYHMIEAGSYNTVGGGTQTNISAGSYNTIGGGGGQVIVGDRNTIAGGGTISVTGSFSTASGGSTITITANNATVGGGSGNSTTQENSTIGGGNNNSITGAAQGGCIPGGMFNLVSAENAFIYGGRECDATAAYAGAGGYQARADRAGLIAFASGRVATDGDSQNSTILLKASTTGATETILRDQASGTDFTQRTNICLDYIIRVNGHRTDVQGDNAVIILKGIATRAGSGVWTITKAADEIISTAGAASWTARIYDATGSLRVAATGEAAKSIKWVATVKFTENIG